MRWVRGRRSREVGNPSVSLLLVGSSSHSNKAQWGKSYLFTTQNNSMFIQQFRITPKKNQRSILLALCEGNPPVTGGFPSQWTSNAESVSISLRYHMEMPCVTSAAIHQWPSRILPDWYYQGHASQLPDYMDMQVVDSHLSACSAPWPSWFI